MSGDINNPDIDDWAESGNAPEGLHGLPEAVAPVKPEGAIEPPHVPLVVEDDDEVAGRAEAEGVSERDSNGRFRQRHRAQSQRASTDDVAAINELTARIKAAEETDGADIARKDGESDRVYTLRRRAELAERRRVVAAQPSQDARAISSPAPPRTATAPQPAATAPDDPEPNHEDADKYPDGVYDRKYINDYARWAARAEHRDLTAKAAKESSEREYLKSFATRVDAAKTKFADFEAVAFAPTAARIPDGSPVDVFIMEDEAGAEVLYHLRKHPAELATILGKNALGQLKDLSLLSQRLSTPARVQAVSTGSAASPPLVAVPRPPNPVRTGPVSVHTDAPGDDDSLEAHERHYYGRK